MNAKESFILITFVVVLSVLAGFVFNQWKNQPTETEQQAKTPSKTYPTFVVLHPDLETDPVAQGDDAADDACFWIHPSNPEKSVIIGTNKDQGLLVYNLQGKQVYAYNLGECNNVDIRYGFQMKDASIDIIGTTNRTLNSMALLQVNTDGSLTPIHVRDIISPMPEVYGFCLYQPDPQHLYGFITGKGGEVEQWEIFPSGEAVDARLVRSFRFETQCEGVVADDHHQQIFVGEEDKGIWAFSGKPESGFQATLIADISHHTALKDDIEGLAIYYRDENSGYLLASSQGNNTYAIFDRNEPYTYLASFALADGPTIDGTYDTDGIDVIHYRLGNQFPYGAFIAQDGANTSGADSLNQNFKLIGWEKIADTLGLWKHHNLLR